jgi:hypothetical protein
MEGECYNTNIIMDIVNLLTNLWLDIMALP